MVEYIRFGDVEAKVVAALKPAVNSFEPGVKVGTKLVAGECLRVRRTGGPRETLISENASILLEAYALSEARAIRILDVGRAVINSLDGPELFGVTEISGPADLPDPQTSQIRWTQLFGVRVRGSLLA